MTHISFVLKYFTAGLNCVQLGQHSQQIFARQTFRPPATAWMTTELHPQSAPLRMFESFLSFASQIVAPWPVYCLCVFSMGVIPSSHGRLCSVLLLLAPAALLTLQPRSQSSAGARTTHTVAEQTSPVSQVTTPISNQTISTPF